MAKSLKEALLERFTDLQELGIAPTSTPVEEDGPAIVVDVGPGGGRDSGARRARASRGVSGYDDDSRRGGDVPIRPRSRPRRGERGGERPKPGGERFRRTEKGAADGMLLPDAPVGGRPSGPRPPLPGGPRTDGGPRPLGPRPAGDRPPFGNRPGPGPRPGPRGVGPGAPRPEISVTERLQQRAEERRNEEAHKELLLQTLARVNGSELDADAYAKFLNDLTQETGALPPLDRVNEAVNLAGSLDVVKIGAQVRMLYRRSRARPAAAPS